MSQPFVIEEPRGTITVPASVLGQIVRRAAEEAPDARVRRPRRLEVEIGGTTGRVALELAVGYGAVLPRVARDVQARVAEALRTMCGVETAVDVSIEELDGEP